MGIFLEFTCSHINHVHVLIFIVAKNPYFPMRNLGYFFLKKKNLGYFFSRAYRLHFVYSFAQKYKHIFIRQV